MKQTEQITMNNLTADFEKARNYVEFLLKENRISDSVISETMLVFEALCHNIFEQREDESAPVKVKCRIQAGYVAIRIGFEGGMYAPEDGTADSLSPEDRILRAYADKIDYSYRSGYNRILISVRRGRAFYAMPCLIGILAAIAIYIPIHFLVGADTKEYLLNNITFPLEELFTNAILMIGAPVTFFSLLKNLTDTYIVAERDSGVRKIQKATMISSVIAVVLAVAVSFLVIWIAGDQELMFSKYSHLKIDMPLADFISTLIPADILTPFQMISPFPLIILAVIITYALCFSGKYFDRTKKAMDTCYALFSRMLSIVMYALPFFVFVSFMDIMLSNGFKVLLDIILLALAVAVSLIALLIFYVIRLKIKKIPLRPFVKKLGPQLIENLKINSAIDAAPFNIRYCVKNYGLDRKTLERSIPVLAQIDLDGNCFIITLITLLLIFVSNTEFSVFNIVAIAVLVFFLSLGAPNQPGSCLIGLLILLTYMNAHDLIPIAIICEVFFGGLLNLTNVIGDIVTVLEKDKNIWSQPE